MPSPFRIFLYAVPVVGLGLGLGYGLIFFDFSKPETLGSKFQNRNHGVDASLTHCLLTWYNFAPVKIFVCIFFSKKHAIHIASRISGHEIIKTSTSFLSFMPYANI